MSQVTGEIVEATMPMNTTLHAPENPVAEAEAQGIAEEFVRTRVADFNSLTPQDYELSAVAPGADGEDVLHRADWLQQDPVSGAWPPTRIVVEVDLDTGVVYSFVIRVEDCDGPTEPQVSGGQAVEAALAAEEELRMTELSVRDVQLRVSPYETGRAGVDDGIQREHRLSWWVQINSVWDGASGYTNFQVDAMTGEVDPF